MALDLASALSAVGGAASISSWGKTTLTGKVPASATQAAPAAPASAPVANPGIGDILRSITDPAAQLLAVKQYAADQVMADPDKAAHFLKNYQATFDQLLTRADVTSQLDPHLVTILTDPNPDEARRNQAGAIRGDMKGLVIADPQITARGRSWAAANQTPWNAKSAAQFMSTLSPADAKGARQVTLSDADIKDLPLEVREHLTLDDAVLYHPLFHPATTDLPNTTKAEMFQAVFRDLGDDKIINLSEGVYHGASFENVTDVTIRVGIDENGNNQWTRIEGFNISGVHGTIEMGSMATIDHMEVDEKTRILKFSMQPRNLELKEPGSTVMNATISDVTFSMASTLQGTNWVNTTFNGTNLNCTDFTDAKFTNATFNGMTENELGGTDFSGAEFKGTVTINGQVLSDPEDIRLALEGATGLVANPPIQFAAHAAHVERVNDIAEARIGNLTELSAPRADIAELPQLVANEQTKAPLIQFSGEANMNEVVNNAAILGAERNPLKVEAERLRAAESIRLPGHG